MQIKVTPYSSNVMPGVYNHQYALFEILIGKKSEEEMKVRPPYSLAICLDISGSMAGDPIHKAKQACIDVVNAMGEKDTVHIIVWSSKYVLALIWVGIVEFEFLNFSAQLLWKNGKFHQKKEMIAKISQVVAGGGTDMHCGLVEGTSQLCSVCSVDTTDLTGLYSLLYTCK